MQQQQEQANKAGASKPASAPVADKPTVDPVRLAAIEAFKRKKAAEATAGGGSKPIEAAPAVPAPQPTAPAPSKGTPKAPTSIKLKIAVPKKESTKHRDLPAAPKPSSEPTNKTGGAIKRKADADGSTAAPSAPQDHKRPTLRRPAVRPMITLAAPAVAQPTPPHIHEGSQPQEEEPQPMAEPQTWYAEIIYKGNIHRSIQGYY